jgi:hypothetical protein
LNLSNTANVHVEGCGTAFAGDMNALRSMLDGLFIGVLEDE